VDWEHFFPCLLLFFFPKNTRFYTPFCNIFSDIGIPGEDEKPKVTKNFPPPEPEYTSGTLFMKHLFALQIKRFHHSRRNKKGIFLFRGSNHLHL